jgi:hypothetical protein
MSRPPNARDWARAYARVQAVSDRQLLAVLREAVRDVNRQLKTLLASSRIGDKVRADQLRIIKRALLEEIAQIYGSLGHIIVQNQVAAAAAAIKLGGELNAVLFAGAGDAQMAAALEAGMLRGLGSTMDIVIARVTGTAIPLSERIYKSKAWVDALLDRKINSALARGLSAREFAKEMEDFFSPNTPGGVRYASMRLSRTEINNAFHAHTVSTIGDAPWVTAMKWNLSRSHPKADDCDVLATQDAYDLGPGMYRPRDTPRKPHPQCFCCVTPATVDEDEFVTALLGGKYDGYITRVTGVP